MIYFIKPIGLRMIKIGESIEIQSRVKSLQTGSPVPLSILFTIDKFEFSKTDSDSLNMKHNLMPNTERLLHQKFKSLRSHGEWFRLEAELEEFLNFFLLTDKTSCDVNTSFLGVKENDCVGFKDVPVKVLFTKFNSIDSDLVFSTSVFSSIRSRVSALLEGNRRLRTKVRDLEEEAARRKNLYNACRTMMRGAFQFLSETSEDISWSKE